ncbi:hypothetical protein [Hydrogenophaga sp. RAC07]|uniref:hypothetical protein n=1 Tax=Hydrogenophaga sp. RAC07 TaxID=1842537 RepID=UPI00083E3332|nr:hypothetical protein [Hydrogenophaga sp. RAC07]
MSTWLRLLLLSLVAPAVAHVVAALTYSLVFLFVAVASFPITVVTTLILLSLLHPFFVRFRVGKWHQVPVVILVGLSGGLMVHLLLSPATAANTRLAVEYAAFGSLNALISWALYNWGPLRATHAHSL